MRESNAPIIVPASTYYQNPYVYNSTLSPSLMKDCNASENGGYVALAPAGDPIISSLAVIF